MTGQEVLFNVKFIAPFTLPADHYFSCRKWNSASGDFLWLSAPIRLPQVRHSRPDLQICRAGRAT